jgi:hypothetical protein
MNPAYKHLADKLRFGELTIGQIMSLLCGVLGGLIFALYLSPFGSYVTLCLSVYVASIPVGAALLAGTSDFDLWRQLRSMVRHHLSDGCYLPGAGEQAHGYAILVDPIAAAAAEDRALAAVDLAALWD